MGNKDQEPITDPTQEALAEQSGKLLETKDLISKIIEVKGSEGYESSVKEVLGIGEDEENYLNERSEEVKGIVDNRFHTGKDVYNNYESMNIPTNIYKRELRHFKAGFLVKKMESTQKMIEINKIDDSVEKEKAMAVFENDGEDVSLIENPQEAINDWVEFIKNDKEKFGMVKSFLLSREMASLFNNLKEGDTMFSSLVPSNDDFSIKNMNDKFFGQQQTDEIIDHRKKIIREEFEKSLDTLSQDFKQDVFVLKPDLKLDNDELNENFSDGMKNIELEMNVHIKKEIKKKLGVLNPTKDASQIKSLTALNERIENGDSSYALTYGMAEVGKVEGGDQSAKVVALSESLQMAQISRSDSESAGGSFSFEKQMQQVEKIKKIGDDLFQKNIFVDADGLSYKIFEEEGNERSAINPDLLRAIRKNKLKVKEGDTENALVVEKLKDYKEAINFFDYVKPQIAEEISGGAVSEDLNERKEIARKLESGEELDLDDFERIYQLMGKELKDPNCSSKAVFHEKAVQIDNCSYISLDVLDVGVDILLSYEKLANKMSAGDMDEESIKKEMLAIGDDTTIKMREFRDTVLEVLKKNGVDNPISLVGGDEFTIALDTSLVSKDLLLAIKEATNTRVIHTAVASVKRTVELQEKREDFKSVEDDGFEERFTEHLKALERAEMGASKVKEIEAGFRDLKMRMKANPNQNVVFGKNGFNPLQELYDNPLGFEAAVSSAKYVVIDSAEGEFKIVWESAAGEKHTFSANNMIGSIGDVVGQF